MSDNSLLIEAIELGGQSWSAGQFQRRMHVGFATAARLLDRMEELGVVGPPQVGGRREVLMGSDEAAKVVAELRGEAS